MTEPAFLLDSNICVYVLADSAGRSTMRLADAEPGTVVTSTIVYAEVMLGIPASQVVARSIADRFFDRISPLPFDRAAADAYTRLPFLRGRLDRLIAAHALSLGLVLVTNNERDFADIPGLKVENWTL